jgi:hypothetical protein
MEVVNNSSFNLSISLDNKYEVYKMVRIIDVFLNGVNLDIDDVCFARNMKDELEKAI